MNSTWNSCSCNELTLKLTGNFRFQELGFEKGWGNTAARVLQNIRLLLDLLQAPDPDVLEKFLARIPMVFTVCIVSPHGYFGQAGVLGMPDTGGQVYTSLTHWDHYRIFASGWNYSFRIICNCYLWVAGGNGCSVYLFNLYAFWLFQVVYILDQVRALESQMLENLRLQGLDFKPQIVIVRVDNLLFLLGSSFIFCVALRKWVA